VPRGTIGTWIINGAGRQAVLKKKHTTNLAKRHFLFMF
jgi:hypothetical protein